MDERSICSLDRKLNVVWHYQLLLSLSLSCGVIMKAGSGILIVGNDGLLAILACSVISSVQGQSFVCIRLAKCVYFTHTRVRTFRRVLGLPRSRLLLLKVIDEEEQDSVG